MQETVLLLGARGRFGLATAKAFADAGWRVLAHMRPGAKVPKEVQGDARIQWLAADVLDTAALAQAAREQTPQQEVAVVVHALNPAYTNKAWQAQVLPMTEAAIALCKTLKATLMLPGNIYNFGTEMPERLREDTPQNAQTVKGRVRIAMEERLQSSGVPAVVIRAGDFFGAGTGTWFDQVIVKDLPKGMFTYPGALDVPTAWAYLPDLAKAFVEVAARRGQLPTFQVLHFAGHTLSARQWIEVLAPIAEANAWMEATGILRYKSLPWGLIRLGALVVPTWSGLAEMRYLWNTPHALDNRRLTALLGSEPHTPLASAVQAALDGLGMGRSADPSAVALRHA
jgi:nucleoside-diphosphate-sugar epimerase